MRNLCILLVCLGFFGCRTTPSDLSEVEDQIAAIKRIENQTVADLWSKHVASETVTSNSSGKEIRADCKPRFYPHKEGTTRQGMVMYLHGFTACPQQYFDIAEILAGKGFDVFLPLMPGQGREGAGKDDYLKDLPSKLTQETYPPDNSRQHPRYREFIQKMNEIAAASTGIKAVAGLSGGGGLATAAAITGQTGSDNIWSRVLLYAPYYRNPGVGKVLSDVLGFFNPGVLNDWGNACRQNRSRPDGRAGYCSINVGAMLAMVQFGEEAAKDFGKIEIPVQFVLTEKDPTADNSAINRAFALSKNARLCTYPLGVPHSLINPNKDLLPDTEAFAGIREANAPSGPPYEWVEALNTDSVRFLTEGSFFPSGGLSTVEAAYGNQFPMCNPASLQPKIKGKKAS